MKKTLIAILTLALASTTLTSCGSGDDRVVDKAFSDSLSIFFGRNVGATLQRELAGAPQAFRDTFSVDDFMKGVQFALNAPDGDSFMVGLNNGLRFRAQIDQWRAQGVEFNKEAFLNNFKAYLTADSVPNADAVMIECNRLINELNEAVEARRIARLEASPEAQKALKQGQAYIAKVMQQPGMLMTQDGIAYRMLEPGDTAVNIGVDTQCRITFTQRLISGKEVYKADQASMTAYNLPRGMGEALMLMHPGAHGIFYIPGALAYGPEGVQGSVGPNELIIFDLTVNQVIPRP